MKKQFWFFALMGTLCIMGCDACQDIQEICDETPSETYLLSVRSVDYDQVGNTLLQDPTDHLIDVCPYHFEASTPAGHAFISARGEWNRQLGTSLHFTSRWTGSSHIDAFDLLVSERSSSAFDYVNVDSTMPELCSLPGDLTFAMRTCKIDMESGETEWFVIFGNSDAYGHYSDLSSDDRPEDHGILHELGHAIGMKHTPDWDEADKQYISTMQGNLKYLSALDVDWLRNKYPASFDDHRNYVASSLTRFDGNKGVFEDQNPSAFYVDGSSLKDCATNADPWFYVAWFNTGNLDGEDSICGANRIYLRKKVDHNTTINIKTWKIATMPSISQDQWKGQVPVTLSNPAGIDFSAAWELVFHVNAWATLDENTDEDNIITMDVELNASSPCAAAAKARPERKSNKIEDKGPVRMLEMKH